MSSRLDVKLSGTKRLDPATLRMMDEACEILENTMRSAELTGTHQLFPVQKCRWHTRNGEKVCLRPSQGRELRIRIRPGNNDICWDYSLLGAHNISMEAVRTKLELVLGLEVIDGNHEQVQPPSPPAQDEVDALASLDKMRAAIERRNQRNRDLSDLKQRIARIDADIIKLTDDKTALELEAIEIEEAISKDKGAKAAEQFAALMKELD